MESTSLLRLLRYHWVVIVVSCVLGIVAGFGLARLATPEYTAKAEVFVMVTGGATTGEVAQSTNYAQQQARNFSAVATREVVLERVIDELGLDLTVGQLRPQVAASVPLNTTVIAITVTDESATRAAEIANGVATSLSEVVPELTPQVDDESPVQLQIIESAVPPSSPSAPSRPLYMFMGLLGGLAVAAVIVVLRGIVLARVRTKEQVSEITGSTVIGSISQSRQAVRNPMALTTDAQSIRAEEYRQLRANLRFLELGEHRKVFVVTSSIPSEGKSSTAANLAAALAASGQSVCLVEADLRKPSLADVLDLPEGLGFTSVLMGESAVEDALLGWGPDGLQVLLAGDIPPNPSELLESPAAIEVIDELRRRFDTVIIDSPPLNPVADAAVLARLFGGVILVVGSRRVRASELRRATERLAAVGATIEGAVLNLASGTDSSNYRYGDGQPVGGVPRHSARRIAPAATPPAAGPTSDATAGSGQMVAVVRQPSTGPTAPSADDPPATDSDESDVESTGEDVVEHETDRADSRDPVPVSREGRD